jgi:hypothetical protein
MDNVTLTIIVVAIIVLAIAFRFREKISVSLEVLGVKLNAEGHNSPESSNDKQSKEPSPAAQGTVTTASGERSVAIGGDAKGATIQTGDRNTVKSDK